MRTWIPRIAALFVLAGASLAFTSGGGVNYSWQLSSTGTDSHYRGLSVVSGDIVWAGGYTGVVLRTTNGGETWQSVGPPGASALQFRDIEGFGAKRAVAMSAGSGADSRIYRTTDGGASWDLTFQNDDPAAFYDCMTFFDRQHGLALSDPVDGKFRILATDDNGRSWNVVDPAGMPAALEGEFAFAASGQCLTSFGDSDAWFATGGGAKARVFHSRDGGQTWTVADTPIPSTPSGGIFALAFRNAKHGLAIGGDFATPDVAPDALALTGDRGKTWDLVADAPAGYRSGAIWRTDKVAIAVGVTGSDYSSDRGRTWQPIDSGSFDTVDCTDDGDCWASGELGRIARLVVSH